MATLPQAFIEHIQAQSLKASELDAFVAACESPLRKSIRVNTLKISVPSFIDRAESFGWTLTPIPWCEEGFWLTRDEQQEQAAPLGNVLEHLQGLYYIQEASSMLPAVALNYVFTESYSNQHHQAHQIDNEPSTSNGLRSDTDVVLDMAAAPGSKTTQLAAMMNNQGLLIANELSSTRLKGLHSNIQRCGVSNVGLSHYDGRFFGEHLSETFDAILLDAPCGGEGTVRKDPDAMKNWSLQALETISELQKQLIMSAYHALKPGGTLIYSTCTLSKEENQQVCEHLLAHTDDMEIVSLNALFPTAEQCVTPEGYLHVFPHIYDSEGFFVAGFKKAGQLLEGTPTRPPKEWPYQRPSKKVTTQVLQYFSSEFGADLSGVSDRLWQRDNEVWLFPSMATHLVHHMKINRLGTKVCELHKQKIRTQHECYLALSSYFSQRVIELTSEQAIEFCQGKDLSPDIELPPKGEVLLNYQNVPLGLAKVVQSKLKNQLPRGIVRDNPIFVG